MPITSTKQSLLVKTGCCDTKYSKQMRVVSATDSISRIEMELTFKKWKLFLTADGSVCICKYLLEITM